MVIEKSSADTGMRIRAQTDTLRSVSRIVPKSGDTGEQAVLWRGDHTFSTEAAAYSLTNFIEPEVQRKHTDWTPEQVHAEAVKRFEKRLSQDIVYEQKETWHEETVVQWQIVETSPGVKELATAYGDDMITLRELWAHTKEFSEMSGNRASYNHEEASAQLAMQEAFIGGSASGYVSILSHPDAIRYVQVWEKSDTGTIVSKQVDLYAATGRDFSQSEGAALIEHLAVYHSAIDVRGSGNEGYAHAYFFTARGQVTESEIRTIAIAETTLTESPRAAYGQERGGLPYFGIPGKILHDSGKGSIQLAEYITAFIGRKVHIAEAPKRPEQDKKNRVRKNRVQSTPSEPRFQKYAETAKLPDAVRSDTSEQSVVLEWIVARSMGRIAPDVPVGAVAYLSWIIGEHPMGMPHQHERIATDSGPGRSPDVHQVIGGYPDMSPESLFMLFKNLFRGEHVVNPLPFADAPRPDMAGVAVPFPGEHRPSLFSAEAVRDLSDEQKLTIMLAVLSFIFTEIPGRPESRTAEKKPRKRILRQGKKDLKTSHEIGTIPNEEMHVIKLLFAYVFRELLTFRTGENGGTEKSPAGFDESEAGASGWLLAAIIWHLAMLRESATPSPTVQKTVKKPKTLRSTVLSRMLTYFPSRSIIFRFAS